MRSFMKWRKAIIHLCRIIFLISIIGLMMRLKWDSLILLVGSLMLTYIPELYTKWTKITIPIGARLFYVVFIFASQWLGCYKGFYGHIFFWDVLLHASSGVFIGYVALILLVTLDRECILFKQNKIGVIVAFIIGVGIAAAGVWEIIEFTGDTFLHTNAQLGSLQDTMEDMICGTLGSCVFALYMGVMMKLKTAAYVSQILDGDQEKSEKNS